MVALAVCQAEQPLFQKRVAAVPEGERQAQSSAVVADAGQAVLAPAIGPAASVIVRQIIPRLTVRAVVLANRAPLPLCQIGSPQSPGLFAAVGSFEAELLGGFGAVGHGGRKQRAGDGDRARE